MPVVINGFPIKEKMPVPESEMRWKAKCRHCSFVKENLMTVNGAEDVAIAHCVTHGHEIEFSWSVIDCVEGVMRPEDTRR